MRLLFTMRLLSDDYNINAFKIISVGKFYGVNFDYVVVPSGGPNKRLPIFELPNGTKLFSANAVCRYLVEKQLKVSIKTDEWLEWEASILQPHISSLLDSALKAHDVLSNCLQHLSYLNVVLEKLDFLSCDNSIGLADIVLWSTLYPLVIIYNFDTSGLPNLKQWFDILCQEEPLSSAISVVFKNAKLDKSKKLSYFSAPLPTEPSMFYMPVYVPDFTFQQVSNSSEEAVKGDSEFPKEAGYSDEEVKDAYESWLKGKDAIPAVKNNEPLKLPKEGERNILITSALPYVNNVPHLGNIIGAVLSADVFARYCRLRNYNTLYVCGTDEYGTATETKAIEEGLTPKEICDKYNKLHRDVYEWFNISFDYFGRTTTEQQTKIAQDIFTKLHERDLLIEDVVEQLYCEACQRFLADRFVEGTCPFCQYEDARGDQCDKCGKLINAPELKQPQCKLCRTTPHLRSSRHLFLDLPKLEPKLKSYLDVSTKIGQWSNTAKVITYAWLREGLKPRCITRDLKWGTPVPLEAYKDKVFYVWYDAPIGYLSITANYTDQWEQWWKQPNKVQFYQFMAKDNVPFHSIIFPACQLGTEDNYTIVNNLVATEYLNYEDTKFSKSRGVGVFGDDAKNTGIPSDIWRFYLLYLRPENQDTYFSWSDLMLKNNSELLNNLGNFINRALSFLSNNFNGIIPEMTVLEDEKYLLSQVARELSSYINCMEKTKLRDAIKPMLSISRVGNQYIQSKKPWELIKGTSSERSVAGTILGISANIACLLCTLMEPYMPDTCKMLRLQLNTQPEHHVLIPEFTCLLPPGHKLGKPLPLFRKIDQDLINQLKNKFCGRQSPEKTTAAVKGSTGPDPRIVANGLDEAEIGRLANLITEQGNIVRQLKSSKAPKSDIDQQVAVLLDLKKKLAMCKGEDIGQLEGKTKKKKR